VKLVASVLLIALVAAVVAVLARFNPGNVVLLVPPMRIDLSLNLALLLLALLLLAVWWLARMVQRAGDFPQRVRAYRQRRAEGGSQRALREAVRALLEGRFARAERAAQAAQSAADNAGVAALIGARAAHRMQQSDRRDQWLARAEADPALDTARLVASAEMWTESRANERALAAIDQLQASGSRHLQAARIALNANLQAARWDEVLRGVRVLEKRDALHPVLAERYKQLAWRELLLARRDDPAALEAAWNTVPAAERRGAELALHAARLLAAAGRERAAAQALEAALEAHWDERLLDAYSQAPAGAARQRIERAEGWLGAHPEDAALLRCLGGLCLGEQLWGKARDYLERSQRAQAHPATSLALARLAETLGEAAAAAEHYRAAALGFADQAARAAGDGSGASAAQRALTREHTI
jgi:HemY protein